MPVHSTVGQRAKEQRISAPDRVWDLRKTVVSVEGGRPVAGLGTRMPAHIPKLGSEEKRAANVGPGLRPGSA
jgi:hypothetical protein